jgi:predicted lipoprotein with Yx(FWY)xxD motif
MKRRITLVSAAAAALTMALAAADCGGSTSTSQGGGLYGSTTSASAPKSPAVAGAANVSLANSGLGRILVDSHGRTLYLFEKDQNGRSACAEQCATYWPPLLTTGKPVAQTGLQQSLVGTTLRSDGSEQVTYAGHPLYRFLLDRAAGETNGEGSQDFGAGWDVLSAAGQKIEADG